jgi:hypothetical protein
MLGSFPTPKGPKSPGNEKRVKRFILFHSSGRESGDSSTVADDRGEAPPALLPITSSLVRRPPSSLLLARPCPSPSQSSPLPSGRANPMFGCATVGGSWLWVERRAAEVGGSWWRIHGA